MIKRDADREPLDTTTEIETPEHVRFRYHVAGPARRALAYLVDLVARFLMVLLAACVVGLLGGLSTDALKQASSGVLLLVYFLVEWFYYLFFETLWSGRTPGKRVLDLRQPAPQPAPQRRLPAHGLGLRPLRRRPRGDGP
jgi:uncharacterized RDD family membrane protein YckC